MILDIALAATIIFGATAAAPAAAIAPEDETLSPPMQMVGTYQIYGYDTCAACCGKTDGITSSGTVATVGRTCASRDFPAGTILYIKGIGMRTVEDTGYLAHGVIDVLCSDHAECYALTGKYEVWVVPIPEVEYDFSL